MEGLHRILFITANLGGGGAERALVNILNNLDRSRFEPHLALFQKEGIFLSDLAADLPLYEIQPREHGFVRRNLVRLRGINRLIDRTRPSLIMSVLWQANAVSALAARAERRSIPLVVNEQTSPLASLRTDRRRRRLWPIARRLYRRADHVIAISQGIARELEVSHISPSDISVIHNPVAIASIRRRSHVASSRVIDHRPAIVAAARLVPLKNFPLLIQSLSRVLREEPVHLYVLGEGPERATIERMVKRLGISEYVHLLGFLPNPYPYLSQADLFVLSSDHEGFGNVLVEAMALGVPVVSTDCPHGPREILVDGKYGLLAPPGDADALAQAILSLLRNPGERHRLSVEGRRRAQDFSVEAILPKYEKLFLDLIADGRG